MAAYTTINDPSAYFKCQLYTGTGSSNAITFNDTDTDMQPDLVWCKQRSAPAASHVLVDAVRGTGKFVNSNANTQTTDDAYNVTAFGSDGFTVGAASGSGDINVSSETYVAWCWKANGSGSANTAGSINTTKTSVESTAKFSINTYDGTGSNATIGHGLSAVPGFFLVKKTNGNVDWGVYHHKCASDPETDYAILNTTAVFADNAGQWNDTAPTSTLISLGTNGECNASGGEYLIYAWSEIQGFSKFGQYEGTGNADGAFIYTGFRPALIISKNIDATSDWYMTDIRRDGYNDDNNRLMANATDAEGTTDRILILSNGFKWITNGANNNANTFVYAAWAEAPLVNSNGVPCNAR